MSRFKCSEFQQQINNVLKYQSDELTSINFSSVEKSQDCITSSEELLRRLGYEPEKLCASTSLASKGKRSMVIPSWEELCTEAERHVGSNCELESIFTDEELQSNEEAVKMLNEEFNALHRMDKYDIAISALAGIVGATVDILLIGVPQKSKAGLQAGPLSNYVREYFDKRFPEEEMQKLANSKVSKVPYDAQDNRNTTINVNGLSAYYHRLLQLGHDPLLGLVFGVTDILTGRMTTIDKNGKIVSQVMENYANRKEPDIFAAIAKQIAHFKSDVTTSMGLPVPLMGLFNLLQFGSIGEEEQTIAEIVQGMYYEGYDFIHFCSMSISSMLVEVIVRLGYAVKRIKEGNMIKDSIPFSLNREQHPKLATMLFIGHAAATAANAGKVYFTKNPVAINYPEWLAFVKYSYKQLKWGIIEKTSMRNVYVLGKINEDLNSVFSEVDNNFEEFSKEYRVVFH